MSAQLEAEKLCQTAPELDPAARLRCAWIKGDAGRLQEAEAEIQEIWKLWRHQLGDGHALTAQALHALGHIYSLQGKSREAIDVLRPAVRVLIDKLGADHQLTLYAQTSFAAALRETGETRRAEQILRRVASSLDSQDGQFSSVLVELATAVALQGRLEEASEILWRACSVVEAQFSKEHPRYAVLLTALGQTELAANDYKGAIPHLEEALRRTATAGNGNHPAFATIHGALGQGYAQAGRFPESEAALRRALLLKERLLGPSHPETVFIAEDLVRVLRSVKKNREAKELARRYQPPKGGGALAPVISAGELRSKR